jgi:hypothetical protein
VTLLSFERYCAENVVQTDLLTSCIKDAELTAPVPSCPEWNLGQLLRHLGGGHRWVETIVRTGATQPLPDDQGRQRRRRGYQRVRDAGADVVQPPHDTEFGSGVGSYTFTTRHPEGNLRTFGTYHGAA